MEMEGEGESKGWDKGGCRERGKSRGGDERGDRGMAGEAEVVLGLGVGFGIGLR